MDTRIVLIVIVLMLHVSLEVQHNIFNFREKLKLAALTNEEKKTGQVIRVPVLQCPDGQRYDRLGNCRDKF